MCDICLKSGIFTDTPDTWSCVISVLNQEYLLMSLRHGHCVISVLNQEYLLMSLRHGHV